MKKRILSLALAVMMIVGLAPMAIAAEIPFTDVPPDAWYYDSVVLSYEMNLVNGTTPTTFSPANNLDGGSAIKLAAAMHQTHEEGEFTLGNGDPWYQNYVDYAVDENIIRDEDDYNWTSYVTRGEFAEIFSEALPASELKEINTVPDGAITDLPADHENYDAIYTLYRAGVLTGAGAEQLSNPDDNIMRSEVATILVRMMDAGERVLFTMEAPTGELAISKQPAAVTVVSGGDATFTVAASGGKTPYTYQWQYKSGGTWLNVTGEDEATLTVTNIVANNEYRCVITDADSTKVESASATVTVTLPNALIITKQPTNYTINNTDQTFTFTVEAEGGKEPYTYQWEYTEDGRWIKASATSATYSGNIKTTETTKIPHFRCTVTDADGNTITTDNVAPVRPRIEITAHPENVVGDIDDNASFSVSATGGVGQLSYQWQIFAQLGRRTWGNMNGATSSTYSRKIHGSSVYSEEWRCLITDEIGQTITSNEATISPNPLEVNLAAGQATRMTKDDGVGQTLEIVPEGGVAPYSVDWLRIQNMDNHGHMTFIGGPLTEEHIPQEQNNGQSVLIYLGPSEGTSAEERVVARVTDALGNVAFSEVFYLTYTTQDLHIASQSGDIIGNVGDRVTISVIPKGGKAPYVYEWQRASDKMGWALPENHKSNNYNFTLDEFDFTNNARYMCKVTDANGDVIYSEVITVTAPTLEVNAQTDAIVTQPGEYFDMAVIMEGGQAPYNYVWEVSTDNGATWNASYLEDAKGTTDTGAFGLRSVIASPAGYVQQWRAVVTDASGQRVTSNVIKLTYPELIVTNNSPNADILLKAGQTFTMEVTAEGGVPYKDTDYEYTYLWQYNKNDGKGWQYMTDYYYRDSVTVLMQADGSLAENEYRCYVSDSAGNGKYVTYDWTFSLKP